VGEQYAVLLGAARRPRVLIEVAWGHYYCGVWEFDWTLELLRPRAEREQLVCRLAQIQPRSNGSRDPARSRS
jgi:hypothetical protein